MEKDWAAKQRQGNKLVLSAEERLERQTTQIGKIIRDAIVRHPSLFPVGEFVSLDAQLILSGCGFLHNRRRIVRLAVRI